MRLFVATSVTGEAAVRVASLIASMRARLPRAAWVSAHSHHITFAFLGEQLPEAVPRLTEALRGATADVVAIDATLARGGFFPSERKARVGWVAIEPEGPIIAAAERVRGAVASCGVKFDDKPFKAHLTLARLRDEWRARDIELFRRMVEEAGAIAFRLDRVSLYESRLAPSGAVHTELAGFQLR